MAFKKIAEWDINITFYADKCKTLADLKKCDELFDNLPKAERTAAFEELWKVIKPPNSKDQGVVNG